MIRLFTAIELPIQQKKILHRVCEGLHGARIIPQAQLHLTLNFIGEVEDTFVQKIGEKYLAITQAPFALTLQGMGIFPSQGIPHILWVGISPCPSLMMLQQLLRQQLLETGIHQDQKFFHPHITLARTKKLHRKDLQAFCKTLQELLLPAFQVTGFHLFSSKISKNGAIHSLEQSFSLQK